MVLLNINSLCKPAYWFALSIFLRTFLRNFLIIALLLCNLVRQSAENLIIIIPVSLFKIQAKETIQEGTIEYHFNETDTLNKCKLKLV